jgi:hypothetical protein
MDSIVHTTVGRLDPGYSARLVWPLRGGVRGKANEAAEAAKETSSETKGVPWKTGHYTQEYQRSSTSKQQRLGTATLIFLAYLCNWRRLLSEKRPEPTSARRIAILAASPAVDNLEAKVEN